MQRKSFRSILDEIEYLSSPANKDDQNTYSVPAGTGEEAACFALTSVGCAWCAASTDGRLNN
jgi:hypothetical protein